MYQQTISLTQFQVLSLFPNPLQFSLVQSLSRVQLFVTLWTAAHQASLSIANSWSLPKLISIELVMNREAWHATVHWVAKSWT